MPSKALGSRTVMSGSISRSKNDPSESLQMMEEGSYDALLQKGGFFAELVERQRIDS